MNDKRLHYKITVTGLVQGVGFRPAIAELAEACKVSGQVKNLGGVVEIIVSGNCQAVENFLHRLKFVSVGRMDTCEIEKLEFLREHVTGFQIVESDSARELKRFLPVDFPTCDRCREELFNPMNRRYRYPFISCTWCGPRYSIQKAVPYDRDSITMGMFDMCPECKKEYTKKGNIRRHAQTIACHNCGPKLKLNNQNTFSEENDTERILAEAVHALQEGKIIAIKDIGGFHFAFSPMNSETAGRLREFKNRDKKPFAVMFWDIEDIREYCRVSEKEEALLTSEARPIVLLQKKKDFVPEVCGESDRIGAMLPCNPLQMLLLKETGPLVMTSGNRGGEPIIIADEEMESLMKQGCPDMMLTHDREILTPLDDSIYQVNGDYIQLIRRARGLVPEPITLSKSLKQDTFAAGGDLKAVFALGRDNMVYLSQYFGDLEDVRCTKSRNLAVKRMEQLLEIKPERKAGDLHPAYISSQDTETKIQHHHAHAASVIAEHGLEGKVLGIVCDGTGYGMDGTIWGSEFLLCEDDKMHRVGHFSSVKLLGGDASAKQADMTLFSFMLEAKERGYDIDNYFADIKNAADNANLNLQKMAWKQNINTAYSSSMGRLFDAVSALLDICHYNSYEGECAIMLEQAAHRGEAYLSDQKGWNEHSADVHLLEELLHVSIKKENDIWSVDSLKLITDLWMMKQKYADLENRKEILAYYFHRAVALAIVAMAEMNCQEYNVKQIALSGGSFINRILLSEVTEELKKKGLWVYTNEKVPCGDGGIALGQMYLASCQAAEEMNF